MEFPPCPNGRHRGSRVVRGGWYGAPGRRRQRWWCHPKTGEPHRFTETLPRLVAETSQAHSCPECQTELAPWEGQPAPRLYGFSAKDVAWALTQVAEGASYRGTAAAVRERAGRPLELRTRKNAKGTKLAAPNSHGQLVSDWVETFAPVIWAHYAPTTWPRDVMADSFELRRPVPGLPRGASAFHVLAVAGTDPAVLVGRPYIAAIAAVPRATTLAWSGLMASLDGQPQWLVADGGTPRKGAEHRWLDVETWRCEWHLHNNLVKALPERVRRDPHDEIQPLLRAAQVSPEHWDAYRNAVMRRAGQESGWAAAVKRIDSLDQIIREQSGSRPTDLPLATGPLEQFFRTLKPVLMPRAGLMTNKRRADALLLLLAARANKWTDHETWTRVIADDLAARKGRAPLQRRHTDPAGKPTLNR